MFRVRAVSLEKLVTVAHPPVPGFRGFGKRWGFEKRSAQMAESCPKITRFDEKKTTLLKLQNFRTFCSKNKSIPPFGHSAKFPPTGWFPKRSATVTNFSSDSALTSIAV